MTWNPSAAEALERHTASCDGCFHTANYRWTRCPVGMELLRAKWAEDAKPADSPNTDQEALW